MDAAAARVSDIAPATRYGILVGDEPALTCDAVRRVTGDPRFCEECV
jgi:hypothetical protein